MNELIAKHCKACAVGEGKLDDSQICEVLAVVDGWQVIEGVLTRTFKFKNYHETMAFVNATAFISHRENHHPDMEVGYNKVTMKYITHSAGGLTENDFICAAKINALVQEHRA